MTPPVPVANLPTHQLLTEYVRRTLMEPYEPITRAGHERRCHELAAEIDRRIPQGPSPSGQSHT